MSNNFKKILHKQCLQLIDAKILVAQQAIDEAQQSANAETKSTAGDKHDTSRAMMQLEVEQRSKQLAEVKKLKQALSAINPQQQCQTVQQGALVETATGAIYYISTSLGKLQLDDQLIFAISPVSPLAAEMLGKKKGDEFSFNGQTVSILNVF